MRRALTQAVVLRIPQSLPKPDKQSDRLRLVLALQGYVGSPYTGRKLDLSFRRISRNIPFVFYSFSFPFLLRPISQGTQFLIGYFLGALLQHFSSMLFYKHKKTFRILHPLAIQFLMQANKAPKTIKLHSDPIRAVARMTAAIFAASLRSDLCSAMCSGSCITRRRRLIHSSTTIRGFELRECRSRFCSVPLQLQSSVNIYKIPSVPWDSRNPVPLFDFKKRYATFQIFSACQLDKISARESKQVLRQATLFPSTVFAVRLFY